MNRRLRKVDGHMVDASRDTGERDCVLQNERRAGLCSPLLLDSRPRRAGIRKQRAALPTDDMPPSVSFSPMLIMRRRPRRLAIIGKVVSER